MTVKGVITKASEVLVSPCLLFFLYQFVINKFFSCSLVLNTSPTFAKLVDGKRIRRLSFYPVLLFNNLSYSHFYSFRLRTLISHPSKNVLRKPARLIVPQVLLNLLVLNLLKLVLVLLKFEKNWNRWFVHANAGQQICAHAGVSTSGAGNTLIVSLPTLSLHSGHTVQTVWSHVEKNCCSQFKFFMHYAAVWGAYWPCATFHQSCRYFSCEHRLSRHFQFWEILLIQRTDRSFASAHQAPPSLFAACKQIALVSFRNFLNVFLSPFLIFV